MIRLNQRQFTRRQWLARVGLGGLSMAGAGLLGPFLQRARAQGPAPRRFVIVLAGNGIESGTLLSPPVQAAIEAEGGSLAGARFNFHRQYRHTSPITVAQADLASAPALAALRGDPDLVDLSAQAAVIYGLSSKVAGGGHSSGYGALSSASARGNTPTGPSIDAWLAAHLSATRAGEPPPFDAVRLGVSPSLTQRLQYGVCAFDARKPAPVVVSPEAAFTMLFGSIASAEGRRAFEDRSDLLTFARTDVRRALTELPDSAPERLKLERYLESLETLLQRQDRLLASEASLRQVAPTDPAMDDRYTSEHPLVRLEVQFELATAALLGQLTDVVVLTSGAREFDLTYGSLEPIFREDPAYRGLVGRHTVCHEAGGNPAYQRVLDAVTTRHVELIAGLARALASAPEGDGTMLDHTAILYLSDNGDQHHSPSEEWPMLMLGGQALGLQTDGRAVVYPAEGQMQHRQVSNVFNTLGWAAGAELNDFGAEGSTRVAEGPLGELGAEGAFGG